MTKKEKPFIYIGFYYHNPKNQLRKWFVYIWLFYE